MSAAPALKPRHQLLAQARFDTEFDLRFAKFLAPHL